LAGFTYQDEEDKIFKIIFMTEFKPLKEIIREEMHSKGLNAQKLSELTGISPRYLKALLDNDFSQMPSAPYAKGYLDDIAKVLEIDPEPLWQEYRKESEIKSSGATDRLPINRYAPKSFNKTALVITIVVLIALAFLLPKISDFLGSPSIEITSPASDQLHTTHDTFTLIGKIGNSQDKLTINSSEVVVNPNGTFEQQVTLNEPGCRNNYDFTVKRFLGLSTTIRRTICYESTSPSPNPTTTSTSSINVINYQ
jgi:cytoskeletal protein RodZ